MANPFATFRKNQKAWMAGTVLLALMAFVVAPAIQQISDAGSGGTTGAEVVRWDGGSVNEGDLIALQRRHNLVSRFLTRLADEVMAAGGTPGVPNFVPNPSGGYFSLGINPSTDPRQICQTLMINDYAADLGITVGEDAAKAFLRLYCDRRIDDAKLQTLLRESTSGQLSGYELTDTIRKHLVATIATRVAQTGISTNSPGQDFNSFRKVTETAKVEVFPVRIEDFIDKVTTEPSEAELKEIFEAGSLRVADASRPEPGFLKTYQADFEYVYGDSALWRDREKAKLTEEVLKAEYDRRVEMGQLMTPVETAAEATEAEGSGAEASGAGGSGTDGAGAGEATDDGSAPSAGEANPDGTPGAPASSDAASEKPGEEGPSAGGEVSEGTVPDATTAPEPAKTSDSVNTGSESPKKEADPAQSGGKEGTNEGSSGDQSRLTDSNVRFVSFQEESTTGESTGNAGSGTEKPAGQQYATGEPPLNELRNDANTAETPTGEPAAEGSTDESQDEDKTATPQEGSESDDGAPATAAGTGDASQGTEQPPSEAGDETPAQPEMRVKTFEEARDEIADSLASQAASTGMTVAITTLRDEHINPYYDEYRQYVALRDAEDIADEDRPAEPPAIDLKQIAESLGLSYGKTGMSTASALFELPFGQSLVSAGQQSAPVAQATMNAQIGVYQPMSSFYFDQTGEMGIRQYQFWKTAEQLAYVPEFEDVRDEVLEAWKVQQARGLAEDAAKSIASKVTAGENAWASAIKDTEQALLIQTNPFTWYTRGANGVSATVVRELDSTGEAFMRSVFSASEGEAVVAPNQPLRVYYVARVQEFSPGTETMLERFGAQPNNASVQQITGAELSQAYSDWYQGLEADLGVQWLQAL